MAILLVAMSSTTAAPSSPGSAAQNGLVLKRACGAAVGRLQRRMIDHVDEMDRGEAAARALLREVADPAEMKAVAHREQRDALLPARAMPSSIAS